MNAPILCEELCIFLTSRVLVYSGIRAHLTLRGRNSLHIYPIGTKHVSSAFFFCAEDWKNILTSLLLFSGGKLATSTIPLASVDWCQNKGQRRVFFFLCCDAPLRLVVRLEHHEGLDLCEGLQQSHDFLQEITNGERSEAILSWNDFQKVYKGRFVIVLPHTLDPPPPPSPMS